MAVRAFARPLSIEEAVEAVVRDALAGQSVIDAARDYGHQVDDRDIYELVVKGLADRAHEKLALMRGRRDGADGSLETDAVAGPAPTKAKPNPARALFLALQANYEAADGTRKPLLQFGLEDALYLRNIAGAKSDGWRRVRDAMDRAVSALRQHSAKTIAALPADEKRAISARLA